MTEALNIAKIVTPDLLKNRVPLKKESIPVWRSTVNTIGLKAYSFFISKNSITAVPDSYSVIWAKVEGASNIRRIKSLLLDYSKDSFFLGSLAGRIISGHWKRNHTEAVNKILENMSIRNYYESADEIVAELKTIKPRPGGSLFRRIEFIEKKLEEQCRYNFNLN
ncbi:MAG: DUF5617 domain-containing protein [Legionella longbeachae]|nr:DUF5617 domain-containing protein [Legionella longbeachae]